MDISITIGIIVVVLTVGVIAAYVHDSNRNKPE